MSKVFKRLAGLALASAALFIGTPALAGPAGINTSLDVPLMSTAEVSERGVVGKPAVIAPAAKGMVPKAIGTSWETMAPLPSERVFNAVVADENGYVYAFGGTSDAAASTPTSTTYRYNVATDTWDTMAAMPVAMDSMDGALVGNKIYLPGSASTDTTYVYDIAADSWTSISTSGGYSARSQYQVVVMGTNVYVLGGIVDSANASTTEVWVLDTLTDTWAAGTPMQKSRTSFSAAAINGEIIVAGGVLFPGFTPDMTTERFNGTTWSFGANIPDGGGTYTRWSYMADGQTADGLWLAAGRRDAVWSVLDHAAIYEPSTDSWTDSPTIPTLAQARVYMEGAVASDGYFYVIGGRDGAGATVYATNERLMVADPVGPVSWTVTPSAGPNGSITPTTPQTVADGATTTFTVTPDAGYTASVGGSCGGALAGTTYTTDAIIADCTVDATFTAITYTVTPSAGSNGTIAPNTPQTVNSGATTTFTVTPDAGYTASVGGTCGGALVGTTYTTNAITANCTVDATFTMVTHIVTPSAGSNGSITPNTPQTVADGATTTFTVTPLAGYSASVGGTCGGALAGTTYTTNAITADCTVDATFAVITNIVTPIVVGSNGSITPNTPQSVAYGGTIAYTLTPNAGYEIDTVTGCGGALLGNVYTTGPITAACTVSASFRLAAAAAGPAQLIPTLNAWMLGLLSLLMAGFALLLWPRRTG